MQAIGWGLLAFIASLTVSVLLLSIIFKVVGVKQKDADNLAENIAKFSQFFAIVVGLAVTLITW